MSGINRVGPDGKKIGKEESAPGTQEFEDIMKIEKTKEVERIEPGEKRKRRLKRPQEEEAPSLQAPSPYEVQKPSSASLTGPAEVTPPTSKGELTSAPPPAPKEEPPPASKEKEPTPPLQEKPYIEEDLPTSPEFWEENLPTEEAEAKKKGKAENVKMPLKEMLGEKIGDKILKEGLIPATEAPTKGKKKKAPLLQTAEKKELPPIKEAKAKSPLEIVATTTKPKKTAAALEKEEPTPTTLKASKRTRKTKISAEEKPLPKIEEKEEEIVLPPMQGKESAPVIVTSEKLSEAEIETLTRKRPLFEKKETHELEGKEKKESFEEEKRTGPKVLFTTLDAVPPQTQVQASQASSQLMPYLSPEMLPLFEKMVGMIIYVAQEGYSRTEFILNTPALSDSVFFGCKIVLEKYATAPNSFNIRLIGGTEAAVQLFTANAENLAQAFKQGEFDFNIGRIEAEFETARPLIRRKGAAREKEEKK